MTPGEMLFTRMLRVASSMAKVSVSRITAALARQWTRLPGALPGMPEPIMPATEPTLMMTPRPRRFEHMIQPSTESSSVRSTGWNKTISPPAARTISTLSSASATFTFTFTSQPTTIVPSAAKCTAARRP